VIVRYCPTDEEEDPPDPPKPGRRNTCDDLAPVKIAMKTEPDPAYSKRGVNPELAKDLQVISVIDELAKQLSPELCSVVQSTVRKAVEKDKRFSKGATIEFE
jgi:hypothetical protein